MTVEDAALAGWRTRLVEELKRSGHLRTLAVESAFRTVPRHWFAPAGIRPEEAYRDEVLPLVRGVATLSQPSIVALMLEELKAGRGMKVLEVGTASGYNAALLAEVVGDSALVYTVELEPRLALKASQNLAAAGYGPIHVRAGDGSLGWPEAAPFARVIVTAEAADLSRHLVDQLEPTGLLLSPFAIPGLPGLLLRLAPEGEGMRGEFVGVPVSFVPLRGEYDAGEGRWEVAARRAREAIDTAEDQVWSEGRALPWERRLALHLVAAALAEEGGRPAHQAGAEAWQRYRAAGEPAVTALRVVARPREKCPDGQLAFRRRDYAFCVDLPLERNPGEGGESPRREVVS
jgi:protein-L-isoaspartate(D-aspartate) O-methyltransferase